MGFSDAFRVPNVTNMADNSTASITQLPANLLEAFTGPSAPGLAPQRQQWLFTPKVDPQP